MVHESTILIVDDQLSAREVLRGVLTGQAYNLAFASSGEDALAKAAELRPDLILLDVMMPDVTGIEVCQRLRADPLLAEVPVIMITALNDPDTLVQGIEAGADDFISKPFNHAELKTRVKTITRLARYRRLLASRSKFEWAVEQASDGYLVADNNDNILYANRQARLYLGLPLAENTPLPGVFLEITHKQYNLEPEQAWTTWPAEDQGPYYLVRPESPTSKAFWLEANASALPAGPEGDWIIKLQDVTAQLTTQRSVWEFQSLVAHKLRTPLGTLLSGLDLLIEDEITKQLSPKTADIFNIVFRSSRRLDKEVRDIMQYLITSTLVQPGSNFNLSRIHTIVSQLSADLELEPITLTHEVDLSHRYIPLSKQALELILREILENAKKFHPNETPEVGISTYILNNDQQVCLEINDNGLTLSPDQLSQVWIPYYQGEKFFTGQIAGMGLGLASVAVIIWSVGGTCRMSNRDPGPGVNLELIIPLVEAT